MNLHDVWAEFTAELAHIFARFHSHPVVVAAVAAQAAAPAKPATAPVAQPDPLVPTTVGPLVPSTAAFTDPARAAGAPGAGPIVTRTDNFDHVLRVPGQHFTLDGGPTEWTVPDVVVGVNFGIEIAGMNGKSHTTIKRPDGSTGQRPTAGGIDIGPADLEFPNGGGPLYVVADQPGTWHVFVRNDDPGEISTIELLDGA